MNTKLKKRRTLTIALLIAVTTLAGCAIADPPIAPANSVSDKLFMAPPMVPVETSVTDRLVPVESPNPQAARVNYVRADLRPPTPPTPVIHTLGAGEDLVDKVVGLSKGVVLIDFYADWCGPCRTQAAILHEMEPVAARHGASILKVNVDEHEEIAARLRVDALPTLIVVKDGKIVSRKSGIAEAHEVAALLAK